MVSRTEELYRLCKILSQYTIDILKKNANNSIDLSLCRSFIQITNKEHLSPVRNINELI